jgi:hypothetical protein
MAPWHQRQMENTYTACSRYSIRQHTSAYVGISIRQMENTWTTCPQIQGGALDELPKIEAGQECPA